MLLVVWALLIAGLSDAAKNTSSRDETNIHITNPYYSGCLHQKLPGWTKLRVCSTRRQDLDPPQSAASSDQQEGSLLCRPPEFDDDYYMEIRIAVGNWASATALGWLTQIILSEIVGVPTSIESNMYGSSRDFYDPQAAIGTYSTVVHHRIIDVKNRAISKRVQISEVLSVGETQRTSHLPFGCIVKCCCWTVEVRIS